MLFFGLHALFQLVFLIGLVAATVWLARFAKKEMVEKIATWALLIGIVGGLLAFGLMGRSGFGPMMMRSGNWDRDDSTSDSEQYENPMREMMEDVWNDSDDSTQQ